MYYIRRAQDKDIKKIADLEDTITLGNGYTTKMISQMKRRRNTKIMVCDDNKGGIMGHCIYNLGKEKIYIFRLVTNPECQSSGIGGEFIQKLKDQLSRNRHIIELEVEDDNVVGHLFLKSRGFEAVKILWGENCDENDLYIFRYDGSVLSKLP